jgi:hypothetical protein
MQQGTRSSEKKITGFFIGALVLVLLCIKPGINLQAQEILQGLSVNPELLKRNNVPTTTKTTQKSAHKSKTVNNFGMGSTRAAGSNLNIPFTDDFSTYNTYPDSSLWSNQNVLINSIYAINPPTKGVATLDGLTKNRQRYDSVFGDTLTSNPINLLYPLGSKIYLSFFYQPQGGGNTLVPGDSLMLEFYNAGKPDSAGWKKIWTIPGIALQPFREVILPINDTAFLKNGFRFRFRNKAIFATADTINIARVGLWHIDNVRLDKNRTANDSLVFVTCKLPFLDDFSSTTVYPDPKLWEDQYAYINSTLALDPLSVGVATLDAIDETGHIYSRATTTPFDADHLTSNRIDLVLSSRQKDSLFLSFAYQPQGIGDSPETGDSLMLEFYNPSLVDSIAWRKMWAVPGDSVYPFKKQLIRVTSEFQQKGFRFRFRNLASISANPDAPGKHGNVDQWHIDYVRLDTSRSIKDTVIRDIACVRPMGSLLQTYQAMPWQHFVIGFKNEIKPKISLTIQNNDTISHSVDKGFTIKDLYGTNVEDIPPAELTLNPHIPFTYQFDLTNPFITNSADSALFEVKGFLSWDSTFYRRWQNNDTVRFLQVFKDYFALDDGSSEAGYGLLGQGTQDAMVAYEFNAYQADTLTAISIYFNPTEDNITTTDNYYFKLAVWSDKNGAPGSLLYAKGNDNYKPIKLNQFYPYKLESGVIVNKGKFYVGWIQVNNNFLNVGFDLNNDNHTKHFINVNGTWVNTAFNGSLMVRPIFRTKSFATSNLEVPATPGKFKIYPNPAQNYITIDTGDNFNDDLTVSIYDITGKQVMQTLLRGNKLDVSGLFGGLYIVKVAGRNINVQPVKLLIQR